MHRGFPGILIRDGDFMTMKEARKASRGLVSRVEKEILYDCTIWNPETKEIYKAKLWAYSEKDLLRDSRKIVEYYPIETRKIMYAMPAETFRANATKIIEIESED